MQNNLLFDIQNCLKYYLHKNYSILLSLTDNEWIKLIQKCYTKINAGFISFNSNEIIANTFKQFYTTHFPNNDLHCNIWHSILICLNFDFKRLQYIYHRIIKLNINLQYVYINSHVLTLFILQIVQHKNNNIQTNFSVEIYNDYTYYQQISYIRYNMQQHPYLLTKLLNEEVLTFSTNIVRFLYKYNINILFNSNICNYYVRLYHKHFFQYMNNDIIKSYRITMKLLQILIEKNNILYDKIITQYIHIIQYTQYKVNKYFINTIIKYLINTNNLYLLQTIYNSCNLTEQQKRTVKPYIDKIYADELLQDLRQL